MKLVYTHLFRIVSFVVLVAVFFALSGIVSTATALVHQDAVDVCCDIDKDDGAGEGRPCNVPDCSCSLCMSDIGFVDTFTVICLLLASIPQQSAPLYYHPQDYISTIEYPPEAA